jgi:hypothetical protein
MNYPAILKHWSMEGGREVSIVHGKLVMRSKARPERGRERRQGAHTGLFFREQMARLRQAHWRLAIQRACAQYGIN